MENKHLYNIAVKWEEGRRGILTSPELPESITVATPPQFPKGEPNIWSPEHLYIAAANSCLMTTFLAIAENSGLEFISFDSSATGKLEKIEGSLIMSEIELKPVIIVKNQNDKERAQKIIEKSEKACLISNSMKSNIILNAEILIQN
jgi:peroxiredoxin-like protein